MGTNSLEGPEQHLLTVSLSIPFNYLPLQLKSTEDWVRNTTYCFGQDDTCSSATINIKPAATIESPGVVRTTYDNPLYMDMEERYLCVKEPLIAAVYAVEKSPRINHIAKHSLFTNEKNDLFNLHSRDLDRFFYDQNFFSPSLTFGRVTVFAT